VRLISGVDTCKKSKNKARSFDALGNAYEENGIYDKAIKAYRRAMMCNPAYGRAYL